MGLTMYKIMNNKTINSIIISFMMICIFLNIIPASIVNAQMLFPNEAPKSVVLSNNNNNNPSLEEFETFLQFMNYYMSIYGPNWQDQVIKIYEDDDDDKDHNHHHNNNNNHHKDWKKWFDNNRHHDEDNKNHKDKKD